MSACQFARPADVLGDAGPDAPTDAPTDARPELVQGTVAFRHVLGANATDIPFDLSAFTVQALIPTGSGFTTAAGVAHADGSFEIDNVTPGVPYVLRLGRSAYVTDAHTVTLRNTVPTRGGVLAATQPTPVTFQIDSAVPFGLADQLVALSRTADVETTLTTTPGQTSTTATVDWMTEATGSYGTKPGVLPDPSAGDDQLVIQYRIALAGAPGGRSVQRIVAAGDMSATRLRDGQTTSVTSTLDAPAADFTAATNVPIVMYATGHSALSRPAYASVTCAALPGAAANPQADGSTQVGPPIMAIWHEGSAPTTIDLSGTYGDPFPSTWTRYCQIVYVRARSLRVPDTTIAAVVSSVSQRVAASTALIATPMPPPTAIRIRGQDGDRGGLLRNDGLPVAITWTGSAQATQYNVTIYQLSAQGTTTKARPLISVTTPDPTLTLPAELLAGSDFISFVVSAVSSTNPYATGTLVPDGIPSNAASTATAMFRWSSTCGDSTPDIGEACDSGGTETAACDADCTAVLCGDGVRNVAAGELCDSIVDTPGCDSDCTANTCGDDHVNAETEQCDDGGTVPGDGCSATCTTE